MYDIIEYISRSKETANYENSQNHRNVPSPDGQVSVYPALGLLGEFGELSEKVKKHMRDGGVMWDIHAIVKELGDILWYWAAMLRERESVDGYPYREAVSAHYRLIIGDGGGRVKSLRRSDAVEENDALLSGLPQLIIEMCNDVCDLAIAYKDLESSAFCRELVRVLVAIDGVAAALGRDLGYVAEINIEKLSSRKERGVISGNGDNR